MLPKPEKIKKTTSSSHQLDMVETISVEDKIRNKRRLLYVALFATIGLSLLFWTYHFITELIKSPRELIPQIVIPKIKSNFVNTTTISQQILDDQVTKLLQSNGGYWNIYIQVLPSGIKAYNWSGNTKKLSETNINDLIEKLKKLKVNDKSIIQSVIPQGLEVREIVITTPDYYGVQSLIELPHNQIFIDIGVAGGDINDAPNTLLRVVKDLYWTIVSTLPTTG